MSKICTGQCGLLLPLESFEKQDGKYYRNVCKVCRWKLYKERINSNMNTFLKKIVSDAKGNSIHRRKVGRDAAGEFSITLDDLVDIHVKQKGLCYYSGIEYVMKQKSDWQCSLERLDPDKGYIPDNVVLVVLELNCASQWSLDKIKEFKRLLQIEHDTQTIDFYETFSQKKKEKWVRLKVDGVDCILCNGCKETKPETDFLKKLVQKGCSKCRAKRRVDHKNTPRGHMISLLAHMRHSTKDRNEKGRNHDDPEYEYDSLIKLWEYQKGLCAYSGIPMTFGNYTKTEWVCSAERLDNSKGYIKGNVCLICHEFNTGGYSGWSKEKVDVVRNCLT